MQCNTESDGTPLQKFFALLAGFVVAVVLAPSLASAHGAIVSINNENKDGRYGGRNYQVYRMLHQNLREWNPYNLNGIAGRQDPYDFPCGGPGQTTSGSHYDDGVFESPAGVSWLVPGPCAEAGGRPVSRSAGETHQAVA